MTQRPTPILSSRTVTALCVLVATVWAASIGLSMVRPDYDPDPAINAIFGGVIGTALTLGGRSSGADDSKKR